MEKIKLNMNYVGAELKGLRRLHNVTQICLSEKTNIRVDILNKIEEGIRMPKLDEIVEICNYFNITTAEYLMYKEVDPCESASNNV